MNLIGVEFKKGGKQYIFNDNGFKLNIGDNVIHTIYGKGVVVGVDKSIVTIAFSKNFGIRKLMKNHKSLKKI